MLYKRFVIFTVLILGFCLPIKLVGNESSSPVDQTIQKVQHLFCPDRRISVFDIHTTIYSDTLILSGEVLDPESKFALLDSLSKAYDFTIIDCPPSVALQVIFFLPIADSFIVPSVPDRLSVRGSMWLLDRIRRIGVKTPALGTLWSLYRQQNPMHKRVVEAASQGRKPYDQLPPPFRTVIPNAAAIAALYGRFRSLP